MTPFIKSTPRRCFQIWIGSLTVLVCLGAWCYLRQLDYGLGLTGMSRDVTWGLYIGQFTFTVGIAASAVMLVLPYYLHNYKAFGSLVLYGEFVAISAVTVSMLFIFADMGQPSRVWNVLLHPAPASMMFWDLLSLTGYLLFNIAIARATLRSLRHDIPPPRWFRPVVLLSIPWAISIHSVTAFLYCGLPGRSFWLTAIMAPRFLASAFASGPALLILICFALRRATRIQLERAAIDKLAAIVGYAMLLNLFFVMLEIFTALYSGIPEEVEHFRYLFFGVDGQSSLVVFTWTAMALGILSLVLLLAPRRTDARLAIACTGIIASLWIDKGLAMIVGGFVPSPLGAVTEYLPTAPEAAITAGIWAAGFLLATVLFRVAISAKQEVVEVSH